MKVINTNFTLSKNDKLVVLTGAGVSAESGLKTFRDNNGLWENHKVEDVATPQAFIRNPIMVWKFYKQRFMQLSNVKPNTGHYALCKLEEYLKDNFTLITQNVDGLHHLAGSKNVLEMHGSLSKSVCTKCNQEMHMKDVDLSVDLPICSECGGELRPKVTWFGEVPYHLDNIFRSLQEADYFLVLGTSGTVYPAAQFVAIAKSQNAKTICVNLTKQQMLPL